MILLTFQIQNANTRKHVQFYTVRLYSSCLDEVERTQENINAEKVNRFTRGILKGVNISPYDNGTNGYYKDLTPAQEFIDEIHDICYDIIYLTQVLENLILNANYTFRDENTRNHSGSLIAAVFTYMPVHMTTLVKSLMPNITVFTVEPTIKDDGSIYNPVDGWVDDLVRLVQYFKWERVILFTTTKTEFPFLIYHRKTVEKLKILDVCMELFHHPGDEIGENSLPKELISFLASGQKLPVIFFGEGEEQVNVLLSLSKYKLLPYLSITHDALVLSDMYIVGDRQIR